MHTVSSLFSIFSFICADLGLQKNINLILSQKRLNNISINFTLAYYFVYPLWFFFVHFKSFTFFFPSKMFCHCHMEVNLSLYNSFLNQVMRFMKLQCTLYQRLFHMNTSQSFHCWASLADVKKDIDNGLNFTVSQLHYHKHTWLRIFLVLHTQNG
jgi:hypothetical protein